METFFSFERKSSYIFSITFDHNYMPTICTVNLVKIEFTLYLVRCVGSMLGAQQVHSGFHFGDSHTEIIFHI